MPVADLLVEGTKLMLLGMGTVFAFLLLLVAAMTGMSGLARILQADETPAVRSPHTPGQSRSPIDEELVSVISAAVRHYRATRR